MDSLLNHFFSTSIIGKILFISQVFSVMLLGMTVILNFIWFGYFTNHWLIVKKRIKYLRQQTCERELEKLANSRVDFVKSSYILLILFAEMLSVLMVPVCAFSRKFTENIHSRNNTTTEFDNCTGDRFIAEYQEPVNRVLVSINVWFFCSIFWLLIGVNSYLNKAYSAKRIIRHNEPIVWFGIAINTIITVIIASYWKALILVVPLTPVVQILQFLILYKSTRKLYEHIRRRCLDSWFENRDEHIRLERMRKSYLQGSVLILIFLALVIVFWTFTIFSVYYHWLLESNCFLKKLLNVDYNFSGLYERNKKLFDVTLSANEVVMAFLTFIASLLLFILHMSILKECIARILKRRKLYKSAAGRFNHEIYQPLMGEK